MVLPALSAPPAPTAAPTPDSSTVRLVSVNGEPPVGVFALDDEIYEAGLDGPVGKTAKVTAFGRTPAGKHFVTLLVGETSYDVYEDQVVLIPYSP